MRLPASIISSCLAAALLLKGLPALGASGLSKETEEALKAIEKSPQPSAEPPNPSEKAQKPTIPVWIRAAGRAVPGASELKKDEKQIPLTPAHPEVVRRYDVQYGKKHDYEGLSLQEILLTYNPPEGIDTVLLHFENGMVVPVSAPLGVPVVDAFVATAIKDAKGPEFPDVIHKDLFDEDLDPIKFSGTKLVVSDRKHPAQPGTEVEFSPWLYVNSLTGI